MQRLRQFSRYFLFFFTRFNPVLAFCLLIDEIIGEIKYGLNTTDFERPPRLKKGDFAATSAFSYMPSNYVLLHKLFTKLASFPHNKTFFDIGCGKGRILSVAAHYHFKEITGVEIVEDYCKLAEKQITITSKKFKETKFNIVCTDAALFKIPVNIECIFLYNPFKESMLDVLISNILTSQKAAPRNIYVIYLNPLFKQNFIAAGFNEVFAASRYHYIKAVILCLSNN